MLLTRQIDDMTIEHWKWLCMQLV